MIVLYYLLLLYSLMILVRVFSTWFPAPRSEPLRSILGWCFRLTEPVLGPLRRAIPPVRMGAVGIDLSAWVALIVIGVLMGIVARS
jgi:YggT family protein